MKIGRLEAFSSDAMLWFMSHPSIDKRVTE